MWRMQTCSALYALRKDRAPLGTSFRGLHASEQSINRTTVAQCRLNPSVSSPLQTPRCCGCCASSPSRDFAALCLCKRISPTHFLSLGVVPV